LDSTNLSLDEAVKAAKKLSLQKLAEEAAPIAQDK